VSIRRAPKLGSCVAALILCVAASEMTRAASITVDNRSSTLTAFALDFSSQNLLADDGAVTFTGAYQSSRGYPPLNETVSYLVALGGSPPGSPYFGSVMLTIEGITDASQDNTQVDMIFNAVVTGPISPNYFVPDPGPVFDVAAFLHQQDAAYVPTDLSVVILSAVPEPSSLVLGGIAVLVGVTVGLRRRSLS